MRVAVTLHALGDDVRADLLGECTQTGGQCTADRVGVDLGDDRDVQCDHVRPQVLQVVKPRVPRPGVVHSQQRPGIAHRLKRLHDRGVVADTHVLGQLHHHSRRTGAPAVASRARGRVSFPGPQPTVVMGCDGIAQLTRGQGRDGDVRAPGMLAGA